MVSSLSVDVAFLFGVAGGLVVSFGVIDPSFFYKIRVRDHHVVTFPNKMS